MPEKLIFCVEVLEYFENSELLNLIQNYVVY